MLSIDMNNFKLCAGETALVIVAHPDDETIWMGGFILKRPDLKWTIFSLCRASDRDRAPKFRRACEYYGARALIADLEDEGGLTIEKTVPIIKNLIRQRIGAKKFDNIFTHGLSGEYGHPRHRGVHLAVTGMAKTGELKAKKFFCFAYEKMSRQEFSPLRPAKNPDFLVRLNNTEFARKKRIMTDIYGFAPNGVDANYCTNPEAFLVHKPGEK